MEAKLKDQFVPYQLSLKLKELGFNETCLTSYDPSKEFVEIFATVFEETSIIEDCYVTNFGIDNQFVAAPLWQQAFDWFKIIGFDSWIPCKIDDMSAEREYQFVIRWDDTINGGIEARGKFNNYKEARKVCLEKLIEIIEKN